MLLSEKEIMIHCVKENNGLFKHISEKVFENLNSDETPIRFVITHTKNETYHCELGILSDINDSLISPDISIFDFKKRSFENVEHFNAVLLVPTGIGAEIGGHAGDATPVARLMASICDNLITHPNVVNASDINEIPENGLYVEGSIICRLLMGTIGLQPVRSNRVLVVIDAHEDETFINAAINSVNGARASCGFKCQRIVQLDPPVKMKSIYTSSGRSSGRVEGIENLFNVLNIYKNEYDAVALSSVISVPLDFHMDYFESKGFMINPWGGVEALLTHTVSLLYDIPSAHSPMFESQIIANMDPGIVDPRMAAEAVSLTFIQCILKGLHRAPKIVKDQNAMHNQSVISAEDISCLVIPDGCIGLPTLAALEQGIPVIAVKENRNKMRNDLSAFPWAPGKFYIVENYWEAAGVMNAIKSGIAPESVRRPFNASIVNIIQKSTLSEKSKKNTIIDYTVYESSK